MIPAPPDAIDESPMKTKGEIEAEITRAIVQFEMDYMGRGPKEARTHVIEDMVLVRLTGVLTPAEQQLTQSADGGELVKKMRSTLDRESQAASLSSCERHYGRQGHRSPHRHQHRFRRTGLRLQPRTRSWKPSCREERGLDFFI